MFTGLIEDVGEVVEIKAAGSGFRVRVATRLAGELTPGDSLAVNGVCLTIVSRADGGIFADVSPETARVTTLAMARVGSTVNLERPLRADSRLGGHFVQGHVDATGTIEEIRQDGESFWVTVLYPRTMASLLVRKGSVTVDGISLTVAGVDEQRFDVQIVPFTWTHTNLQHAKAGDTVNLEFDILGKYVARIMDTTAR
jgi:riboflavin synthase